MVVRVPRTKKGFAAYAFAIAAILLVISVFMGYRYITVASKEPVAFENVSKDEIKAGNIYYATDIILIDGYASLTSNNSTSYYCFIAYYDNNDDLCVSSMRVSPTDEIYGMVSRYIKNPNAGIGDCIVSAYIESEASSKIDSKVRGFYEDSIKEAEENEIFYKTDVVDLNYKYLCSGDLPAEGASYKIKSSASSTALGCLAGALVAGLLGLLLYKLSKKKEEE
ncbi:MAG: hypothetical protein MJ123_08405 [Lachnospiraceae bacterium]|nr:hypothetical protein [Lachnospiraceae bacterium]